MPSLARSFKRRVSRFSRSMPDADCANLRASCFVEACAGLCTGSVAGLRWSLRLWRPTVTACGRRRRDGLPPEASRGEAPSRGRRRSTSSPFVGCWWAAPDGGENCSTFESGSFQRAERCEPTRPKVGGAWLLFDADSLSVSVLPWRGHSSACARLADESLAVLERDEGFRLVALDLTSGGRRVLFPRP